MWYNLTSSSQFSCLKFPDDGVPMCLIWSPFSSYAAIFFLCPDREKKKTPLVSTVRLRAVPLLSYINPTEDLPLILWHWWDGGGLAFQHASEYGRFIQSIAPSYYCSCLKGFLGYIYHHEHAHMDVEVRRQLVGTGCLWIQTAGLAAAAFTCWASPTPSFSWEKSHRSHGETWFENQTLRGQTDAVETDNNIHSHSVS